MGAASPGPSPEALPAPFPPGGSAGNRERPPGPWFAAKMKILNHQLKFIYVTK